MKKTLLMRYILSLFIIVFWGILSLFNLGLSFINFECDKIYAYNISVSTYLFVEGIISLIALINLTLYILCFYRTMFPCYFVCVSVIPMVASCSWWILAYLILFEANKDCIGNYPIMTYTVAIWGLSIIVNPTIFILISM